MSLCGDLEARAYDRCVPLHVSLELTLRTRPDHARIRERADLGALQRARREDDHRQTAPFAQAADQIDTVDVRQPEIENDCLRACAWQCAMQPLWMERMP